MTIEYNEIDNNTKLIVADILSKREAVESVIADIQTERALAQIDWDQREQNLNAEKNKLTQDIRNIRKATISITK